MTGEVPCHPIQQECCRALGQLAINDNRERLFWAEEATGCETIGSLLALARWTGDEGVVPCEPSHVRRCNDITPRVSWVG